MRPLLFKLTARPALLAALLFLVGFGLTASLPAYFGWPQPVLHDEFAYLFEAETFADGRLTNPPPIGPPESFATFHHLISPVYIGKFPPGQGLALAMGVLLGHAIIGVWIINGLWAIALYWMLRGVAPPGWSLLGAVAGVATYGAFSYWGQTYWGGGVLGIATGFRHLHVALELDADVVYVTGQFNGTSASVTGAAITPATALWWDF